MPGDAAKRWVAAVEDPARRQEMAYELDEVAAEGEAAVPAILPALAYSADPYVRGAAAAALGELEAEPGRLIPPLVEALYDPNPWVPAQAAIALAKIGAPAVPALIEVLEGGMRPAGTWTDGLILRSSGYCTGYWIYRPAVAAALALADIGAPAVSGLVSTLQLAPRTELGFDTYLPSLVALRRIGSAAIPVLIEAQVSTDSHFRLLAAIGLARIRSDLKAAGAATVTIDEVAPAATASLSAALSNLGVPDTGVPGVNWWMRSRRLSFLLVKSLGQIGPSGVPSLVAALRDAELEYSAIEALAQLGSEADAAVPALLAIHDLPGRRWAILALGRIGSEAAVRNLAALIDGSDLEDASIAAYALEEIGPAAVPILSRALARPSLRSAAASVLEYFGADAESAVPALLRMLSPPTPGAEDDRRDALSALRAVGPPAQEAVPALIRMLDERAGTGQHDVREETLATLGAIGPGAKAAVPALIRIIRRPGRTQEIGLRLSALYAVQRIGPGANAAIPAIVSALSERQVADAAVRALRGIGPRREVVRALVIALNRRDIQREAASALLSFGPAAWEAAPALRRMRKRRQSACTADLALLGIKPGPASAAALSRDACAGTRETIESCERIGPTAVPFLVKLMQGRQPLAAVEALARMGSKASAARPALEAALKSSDAAVGKAAAHALTAMDSAMQGAVATIASDEAVHGYADGGWAEMVAAWSGPLDCKNLEYDLGKWVAPQLPRFPWRPPHFSAHEVLPRLFAGTANVTLGAVYSQLAAALRASGFEDSGIFAVPGGFALVTRLEHIQADGSADPRRRWSATKDMPFDLFSYLSHLFLQRRGEFRLIAFLVTSADDIEKGTTDLTEEEARMLSLQGGRVLPTRIAELPFAGRDCHVLIYHFARRHGGAVVLRPSELSAYQHLQRAGLWQRLTPAP